MKVNYYDETTHEKITVEGHYRKYYITLGVGETPCLAGPYVLACDALAMLKRFRPDAHAVCTVEW